MIKSPGVIDHIHIGPAGGLFFRTRLITPLNHQVQPTMAIINQDQIRQAIMIQIARQHVARTFR